MRDCDVPDAPTLEDLERDPAAVAAVHRPADAVWMDAIDGWYVISRDAAIAVLRDPGTFTVDDPRFTTAQVVGPSMLSLDGDEHRRHRQPFVAPFRRGSLEPLEAWMTSAANGFVGDLVAGGGGDVRTAVAAPLAASTIHRALGLVDTDPHDLLGWYRDIVDAVSMLSGGADAPARVESSVAALGEAVRATLDGPGDSMVRALAATDLTEAEIVSNVAVVLFGAIETTEGMVANAVWHVLSNEGVFEELRANRALVGDAIEESLRLEPAASVVDRYATSDTRIGDAEIRRGQLVRVSLSAAGRDPAVFEEPDLFVVDRPDARLHLAFATGPHLCVGLVLARLQTAAVLDALLDHGPGIALSDDATGPRGLVFRKPDRLSIVVQHRRDRVSGG